MGKRKPKLKTGTRQYGKPKSAVTVAPCPWDMGTKTLAAKTGGNVGAATKDFREWLRANPVAPLKWRERIIDEKTGEKIDVDRVESEEARMKRAAEIFIAREIDGVLSRVEDATDATADGEIKNPNEVKRMRRIDMLETWHRKGVISTRGYTVGERLRNAFEATQRAPGWPDNDRVQSSPKPDQAVAVQIDRVSMFAAVYGLVIASDRPIVDHCILSHKIPASMVYQGRRPYAGPRYQAGLEHLREALERLADAMERRRG